MATTPSVSGSSSASSNAALAAEQALRAAEEARRRAEEARRRAEEARRQADALRLALAQAKRALEAAQKKPHPDRAQTARLEKDVKRLQARSTRADQSARRADAELSRRDAAWVAAAKVEARRAGGTRKELGTLAAESSVLAAEHQANRDARTQGAPAPYAQADQFHSVVDAGTAPQALQRDLLGAPVPLRPADAARMLRDQAKGENEKALALQRQTSAADTRVAGLTHRLNLLQDRGGPVAREPHPALEDALRAATQRALALHTQLDAQTRRALQVDQDAFDALRRVHTPGVEKYANLTDLASDPVQALRLLGSVPPVPRQQVIDYDLQRIHAATGKDPVGGSQELLDRVSRVGDPEIRRQVLEGARGDIRRICDLAAGNVDGVAAPGSDALRTLAVNLSRAGSAGGPEGAQAVAAAIAPALDNAKLTLNKDGRTFNGSHFNGALANAATQGEDPAVFRAIPAELQKLGKADSSEWKVKKHDDGVFGEAWDAVSSFATGHFSEAWDHAVNAGGDLLHDVKQGAQWVERSVLDLGFKLVTDPVNDHINQLKPGETYTVEAGGSVDLGVHAAADGQVSVTRGADGRYVVKAGLDATGGIGEKLGLGGDLAVGGGARAELTFDNAEDAKRGADAFVRVGASLAVPGLTALVGPAELTDGDGTFLARHLSAVELKGEAVSQAKANLGLGGTEGTAQAQGTGGLRVELDHGNPVAVTVGEQFAVSAEGHAGAGGKGADASGNAAVTVESRVALKPGTQLGDLLSPGKTADDLREGSVQTQIHGQFRLGGGAERGSPTLGTDHQNWNGVVGQVTLTGDPAKVLPELLPALARGNLQDVQRLASKDVQVAGSLQEQRLSSFGFHIGIPDVFDAGFSETTKTPGRTLARFGPEEPGREQEEAFEEFLQDTAG